MGLLPYDAGGAMLQCGSDSGEVPVFNVTPMLMCDVIPTDRHLHAKSKAGAMGHRWGSWPTKTPHRWRVNVPLHVTVRHLHANATDRHLHAKATDRHLHAAMRLRSAGEMPVPTLAMLLPCGSDVLVKCQYPRRPSY